jgi:ElaB/YqjD/DUF883 family membrane-anchored ribosome-binding protein
MPTNLNDSTAGTRDKLVEDVKMLTKDVQDLLKVTASVAGEKAADARSKVEASLKVAQEKIGTLSETAKARGREAALATHEYVQENPWNAVGVAAGVGLLIGLVLAATFSCGGDED